MLMKQLIGGAVLAGSAMALGTAMAQVAAPASGSAAGSVAGTSSILGVVSQVKGGRVTVRLDDGRTQTFSAAPGALAPGDRIRAQMRKAGDAQRLEQIQKQN